MFKYYNLRYEYNIINPFLNFFRFFFYMQILCLVEKMHQSNLNDEGASFCNTHIIKVQ
jgi:hypothetical protein